MTGSSDLLVSYPRRRFFQARREIVRVLERVGDPAPVVERSSVPGIAIVHTRVDNREAVKRCRELSAAELPLEFAVKWVPVDFWCETSLEAIRRALEAHVPDRIAEAQTWAMKVEKRRWTQHHTTDIITALAPSIPRKVDLQHPDRTVRIDVLGARTAISLLAPGEVFSIGTSTGPSRRRETRPPAGSAAGRAEDTVADLSDAAPGGVAPPGHSARLLTFADTPPISTP